MFSFYTKLLHENVEAEISDIFKGNSEVKTTFSSKIGLYLLFKCVADSDEQESAKEKPRKRRRKGGSDALKFLEANCQADAEVNKEVALRQ